MPDDRTVLLDIAERYEKLKPRGRAFVDAEQNERIADRKHQARYEWAGLIVGSIIGVGALAGSIALMFSGHGGAIAGGATLGITDISALAGLFIYGTQKRGRVLPPKADSEPTLADSRSAPVQNEPRAIEPPQPVDSNLRGNTSQREKNSARKKNS